MRRFPEPTSGFTHLAGAILAAIGLVWLIVYTADTPVKLGSLMVYGVSTILIFVASSALHLIDASPTLHQRLRRFDHAAIFLCIAGTYTPFCFILFTDGWRWGMLAVIWLLAIIGIVYKLCCQWRRGVSTLVYVGMGWLALIPAPVGIPLLPANAVALLIGGGVVYSVGALVYALDKPNLHRYFNAHDLWHVFVLGGSALHFAAIIYLVRL